MNKAARDKMVREANEAMGNKSKKKSVKEKAFEWIKTFKGGKKYRKKK